MMKRDDGAPVYVISIAAKLVDMHPQTLRLYERVGLIRPARTGHNIRLFSDEDIKRLRQIQRLTNLGLNLAGVEMVMDLLERMEALRREMEDELQRREQEMQREFDRLRQRVMAER